MKIPPLPPVGPKGAFYSTFADKAPGTNCVKSDGNAHAVPTGRCPRSRVGAVSPPCPPHPLPGAASRVRGGLCAILGDDALQAGESEVDNYNRACFVSWAY